MEEKPEHVEDFDGKTVCKHCGGDVAEDGYALGGIVSDDPEEQRNAMNAGDGKLGRSVNPNEDGSPKGMRETSFVDALRKRKGG